MVGLFFEILAGRDQNMVGCEVWGIFFEKLGKFCIGVVFAMRLRLTGLFF